MTNKSSVILRNGPVVCAVGEYYHIIVPVKKKVLMSVVIGDKVYANHSNGIRRTDVPVQRFIVPQKVLDSAKKYTIVYEEMIVRMAYSCIKGATGEIEYTFKPLEKSNNINIYHISDCHGLLKPSVDAASFFGDELDLLILNGDIASSSSKLSDILLTFDIAFNVTKGSVPCIISRGNHDLRGKMAEKLDMLMPVQHGNSYYSVKFNSLWLLLLDCGEDKLDSHEEYSATVACHQFREEETAFLESIVDDEKREYNRENIKYKIVVSHVPFYHNNTGECNGERPFNIETELYTHWCDILREKIKPHFYIAGHLHRYEVCEVGGKYDSKGIKCPVVIGGKPLNDSQEKSMIGAAITLLDNCAEIRFTDSSKNVLSAEKIEF